MWYTETVEIKELLEVYAQDGFEGIVRNSEKEEIARYIEEHAEVCPVELYRGLMGKKSYEVGQIVEFKELFASFDENIEMAEKFATRRDGCGTVLILEDGEGIPLYTHVETCADETEWLILDGKYVVEDAEQDGNLTYVRIRKGD